MQWQFHTGKTAVWIYEHVKYVGVLNKVFSADVFRTVVLKLDIVDVFCTWAAILICSFRRTNEDNWKANKHGDGYW